MQLLCFLLCTADFLSPHVSVLGLHGIVVQFLTFSDVLIVERQIFISQEIQCQGSHWIYHFWVNIAT